MSKFKVIIISLLAVMIFIIAGAIRDLTVVGPQLWGIAIPLSVVPEIFKEEFSWPEIFPNKLNFVSGSFSDNQSKCNTDIIHLEKGFSGGTLKILIGKIDDLKYSEKCLKKIGKNYHALFSSTLEKTTPRVSNKYVLYVPWTNFNTRLVPKGNCLKIYGIQKDTMYQQTIGENQAQIIEGEFDRIAFEVIPNYGIIRNYVKEYRFNGLQYGKLILLHNNNGKFAFVLFHSYAVGGQNISPYLDSLQKDLVGFKILK